MITIHDKNIIRGTRAAVEHYSKFRQIYFIDNPTSGFGIGFNEAMEVYEDRDSNWPNTNIKNF